MATYEITDSILKRHAEQMAAAGSSASAVAGSVADTATTAAAAVTAGASQAAGEIGNSVDQAASAAGDTLSTAGGQSSPWKGLIYAVVAIVVVWLAMKLFGN